MEIWDILLIGVALALDAVAVGMTDGMAEPHMSAAKTAAVAAAFGLFQFGMPLIGYSCGYGFSSLIGKIAPYLSFAILLCLGAKMIYGGAKEAAAGGRREFVVRKKLGAGRLLVQAVATSIDALAVGVTLLAAERTSSLPAHVAVCALVIGAVTFCLCLPAVEAGKRTGAKFEGAECFGGAVLILIGVKILLEGVL